MESPSQVAAWRHDSPSPSPVAVLLIHGFTGSPASMRPWGEYLATQGRTVAIPRLPGHGTTWQDMNTTSWPMWYAEAEQALLELVSSGHQVVVGGLSMGGALASRLAARYPKQVTGLMLVNPAFRVDDKRLIAVPLLRHLVPSAPGVSGDIAKPGVKEMAYDRVPLHALYSQLQLWKQVEAELPQVQQSVLLMLSEVDHVVPPSSAALFRSRVASRDITEVRLPRSYHVATLDYDAPIIFRESEAFIERISAQRAGRPPTPEGDR